MNMKNALKKILAVGAIAVLGGSFANAATLDSYPSPFVEDGKINSAIVVGENAKVADVVGAINIAASLQSAAVSEDEIEVEGSSTTNVNVENGVNLETRWDKLILGDSVTSSQVFDVNDLPDILAEGKVTSDNEEDISYTQELRTNDGFVLTYDMTTSDDVDNVATPMIAFGTGSYMNLSLDFDDTFNVSSYSDDDNVEMSILGREFVVDTNKSTSSKLILLGSSQDVSIELNEEKILTVGGEDVAFKVIGGTDNSAVLSYEGKTKSVSTGTTFTVNSETVRVKDVIVSDFADTQFIIVNLMVGSDKVVLSDGAIEVDDEVVAGMNYTVSTDFAAMDELSFNFNFSAFEDEDEDLVKAVVPGRAVVDPLFKKIAIGFDGAKGGLESGDYVKLDLNGKLNLEFTNLDGDEYKVSPLIADDDKGYVVDDFILTNESVNLTQFEDFKFFFNHGSGDEKVTKLYEITDVDSSENKITIEDVKSGVDKVFDTDSTNENFFGTSGIDLTNFNVSTEFVTYERNIIGFDYEGTEDLEMIEVAGDYVLGNSSAFSKNELNITFKEFGGSDTFEYQLDIASDEFEVNEPVDYFHNEADEDDEVGMYLSTHGTYIVADTYEEKQKVEFYFPGEDPREFVAALGNNDVEINQETTETDSALYTTQTVNNMADYAKLAMMDTEAIDMVSSTNMIVVGGPCVNAVAADLMDASEADCAAGFEPGKSMIKLFGENDVVAMVVAGYNAEDTLYAANFLANYREKSDDLTGDEISLTSATTEAVNVNAE